MTFQEEPGKTVEWGTPDELFDPLNAIFHFNTDVCASDENTKVLTHYYTIKDNGLVQQWEGVCWMNPPYGPEIIHWLDRAREMAREEGTTTVCLIPSRTDNEWWHRNVMKAGELVFLRGRVTFVGADTGAKFASALCVFRHDSHRHPLERVGGWDWAKGQPYPYANEAF